MNTLREWFLRMLGRRKESKPVGCGGRANGGGYFLEGTIFATGVFEKAEFRPSQGGSAGRSALGGGGGGGGYILIEETTIRS